MRLILEELEGREVLSPVVIAPSFEGDPRTLEGEPLTFSASDGGAFWVRDSETSAPPYPVVATLTSARGTFLVDAALAEEQYAVTVTGNDSAAVNLTGSIDDVNAFLQIGFEFTPAEHYSGDADIGLVVTRLDAPSETDSDAFVLQVEPVASDPTLTWATQDEVRVRTEPFAFRPGFLPGNPSRFLAVGGWPDADGSETFSVTLSLFDPSEREAEFLLSANGVRLDTVSGEPGLWLVEGTNAAAFQALLDSLVLTPPADYSGRIGLTALASLRDVATYRDAPPASDPPAPAGPTVIVSVTIRFFEAARFTAPPAFAREGAGPIDLGGRYAVDDPAELEEDSHSLTIAAPRGTLAFDPAAVPIGLAAGRDGSTILLTGDLSAINQFLATPGGLTYAPDDPFFSGRVPLTLTLVNHPGEPAEFPSGRMGEPFGPGPFAELGAANPAPPTVAVASVAVVPVAGHAFPSAADAATNQDTPVALALRVISGGDADGSESVLVVLDGVPAGAAFDRGTNLGGGQWAFAAADLAGLVFVPPPGATGTYAMTMRAVVTDTAPDLGLADSRTDATAFAVVVNPAPVTPAPVVPLPLSPAPDASDPLAARAADPVVVGGIDTATDATDDADDPSDRAGAQVAFAGNTAGADGGSGRGADGRAELSAPGPESLFVPADAALPNYGYDDKHPLPPVAPLDQTNPVAVYTDPGGDSFALVEKFYRDAPAPEAPPVLPLGTAVGHSIGIRFPPRPVAAIDPTPDAPPAPAPAPAPPDADAPAPAAEASTWRAYYAAAGLAVGAAAAWLARGWGAAFAQYVRRLLHTTIRLQPKKPT